MTIPNTFPNIAASSLIALCLMTVSGRAETIDELYTSAKNEKELVFYSGSGEAAAKATAAAFEKRFPGITVRVNGGFSNVLDLQIDEELKTDLVSADFVQLQTIQDFHRWDKAGALMHFKPDGFDQVLTPMKDKEGAWVAVNAVPLYYAYNSDKVTPADVPTSALDFLKPQFREKSVTVYPAYDDATLYNFDLIVRKYGWDYMTKYMENRPFFIAGSHREVATRLKSGDGFVSFDNTAAADGSLKIVLSLQDQTPVFFTAGAILAKAPHPNAAKLFMTWFLSKEQQGANPALYSPRVDMPPPSGRPKLDSAAFANGYADFLGDGSQLEALRKRFESYTGAFAK